MVPPAGLELTAYRLGMCMHLFSLFKIYLPEIED